MATRSARCRSARAGSSTRPTSPCCSTSAPCPFPERRRAGTLDALEAMCREKPAALIVEPLDPRRRRHADLRTRGAEQKCADLRGARRAVHRRRSDDRLGPHRHAAGLRAGRYRARHIVSVEGADRRLGAAGGDDGERGDLRRASFATTARGCSSIRRATPPTRSPAPPPPPTWRSGARSRCWSGSPTLGKRQAARLAPSPSARKAESIAAGSARSPPSSSPTAESDYLSALGPKLGAFFRERGLLLRPLGNTVYVMPPYCIDDSDLDALYDGIADAAKEMLT
jgi:adenosylmethionine-8-amino-7-oxononanoate aminotransferase